MGSYIFITTEGYTYQPGSKAAEPDIENCQVLGFAKGDSAEEAFKALLRENPYLLETSFDEVVCLELKNEDYGGRKKYLYLRNEEYKVTWFQGSNATPANFSKAS